jgi:hypothetical protein
MSHHHFGIFIVFDETGVCSILASLNLKDCALEDETVRHDKKENRQPFSVSSGSLTKFSGVATSEMNVTDEIVGDIQQHTAALIYLGNDIAGRKFEEIRVMVVGDSSMSLSSLLSLIFSSSRCWQDMLCDSIFGES